MEKSDSEKVGGEDDSVVKTPKKGNKRRFPHSIEGSGGERRHRAKKARVMGSSKSAADSIMMRRLGGSQSDPLNLLGTAKDSDQCSSCMSSPTQEAGQPAPPPPFLQRDPLNLEGKGDLSVLLKGEDKPGGHVRLWFQTLRAFLHREEARTQGHGQKAQENRDLVFGRARET